MNITNSDFQGNGTSLWGVSKGTFTVNRIEVPYVNWVAYPNDTTGKLHASVNLFGPNTHWSHYTDKAIINQLRERARLIRLIRAEIQSKVNEAKIKRLVPAFLKISWSEQGLQPHNGWNFDVSSGI